MIFCSNINDSIDMIDGVDLTLTDPPYNVGLNYSKGDDRIAREAYEDWLREWFLKLRSKSQLIAFTPGIVNVDIWYRIEKPKWVGIWKKSNQCASTALGGFNAYEPILFYGKRLKALRQDVWDFPIKKQKDVSDRHPCPKLLEFWTKLLSDLANKNHVIYDPFLGSGTTALAAKKLEMRFIGSDYNYSYCKLAKERLMNA